jgi:hypothetical protein
VVAIFSQVLDIGWTPEFRRKSRVSGVGCPSGAMPWSTCTVLLHFGAKKSLDLGAKNITENTWAYGGKKGAVVDT